MVRVPTDRGLFPLFALAVAACDSDSPVQPDAPVAVDALPDVPVDVAPADAPCERTLLADGMTTGWTLQREGPNEVTSGADYVQLQTSTTAGQTRGGQLLLTYEGAVTQGIPFALEVVMLVQSVGVHNPSDAPASIMGSFTPPFGTPFERAQMIYLDADRIGWADDAASHTVAVTDGAYHTYVLAVDAAGAAQVTIDGTLALTRTGFVTNGTIAVGDQTNEKDLDSTLRIRSVRLLCP